MRVMLPYIKGNDVMGNLCYENEIWKSIPGYEGIYEASSTGRIRTSIGKTTKSARFSKRVWKQRILKQKYSKNRHGRVEGRVELWKDGNHRTFLVSRLVAMAFCDGYSEGMTVNHIDGDPLNNRIENLEWVTRGDNIRKAFDAGMYGSCCPVKLTDSCGRSFQLKSLSECDRFLGRGCGYSSNTINRGRKEVRSVLGDMFLIDKEGR